MQHLQHRCWTQQEGSAQSPTAQSPTAQSPTAQSPTALRALELEQPREQLTLWHFGQHRALLAQVLWLSSVCCMMWPSCVPCLHVQSLCAFPLPCRPIKTTYTRLPLHAEVVRVLHGVGVVLESRNLLGRILASQFVDKASITGVIINEVRLCAHELPCWAAPTPSPLPC